MTNHPVDAVLTEPHGYAREPADARDFDSPSLEPPPPESTAKIIPFRPRRDLEAS